MSRVRIEGLRELEAGLKELPRATGKNAVRRALRQALEPMADEARARVPVDRADLKNSITVTSRNPRKNKRQSDVEVHMGPGRYPAAHLQEFGARHHGPQPFMRPAWNAQKQGALNSVRDSLAEEIEKAAQRMARKAARLARRAGG